jgi:hypothetical protein
MKGLIPMNPSARAITCEDEKCRLGLCENVSGMCGCVFREPESCGESSPQCDGHCPEGMTCEGDATSLYYCQPPAE